MSLDVLARGRAAAEARMTATCTISRDGERTWNPATLQYEDTDVTVYDGKCRVKSVNTQDRPKNAADQGFVASQYELHLPVDGSEGVRKDDRVLLTGCPEDAAVVGRRFTVDVPVASSQTTARRLAVQLVV